MKTKLTYDRFDRVKIGSDEELSLFYNSYVHKMYSYGLRIHADKYLVQDCIQDIFVRLIERRKDLALFDVSPMYLFKALRHELLEEKRSTSRRVEIVNSIPIPCDNIESSKEQLIINSEEEHLISRRIEAALDTLTDYQKEVIFLKYIQGFEYEKIAELLDIDISSARTLVYRSLKKVKESVFSKTQLLLFFFRFSL